MSDYRFLVWVLDGGLVVEIGDIGRGLCLVEYFEFVFGLVEFQVFVKIGGRSLMGRWMSLKFMFVNYLYGKFMFFFRCLFGLVVLFIIVVQGIWSRKDVFWGNFFGFQKIVVWLDKCSGVDYKCGNYCSYVRIITYSYFLEFVWKRMGFRSQSIDLEI